MPDIAVVIVNWRLPETTLRCLASLTGVVPARDVFLVDNGSGAETVAALRTQCPGVVVIPLPENRGFAAACNIAIRRILADARYEYVFLFNNDALLAPDALSHLLAEARAADAGILGPKVYDLHQPDRLWYAGAKRRRLVLAARATGRGERDVGQYAHARDVDYVFGAAMLIRRDVFVDIGLFDERFFLYLEDLDFCLRAQQAGHRLRFVPQAHVWHEGSASTRRRSHLRRYYLAHSTLRFLAKHSSPLALVPQLLFWSAVVGRTLLADALSGNWSTMRATFSAALHVLLPGARS